MHMKSEKGEELAASADCKLGRYKHNIFIWRHRIVKQKPMFYYFQDKHKLLEGKLQFKGHNYKFKSYEMELCSVVDGYQRGLGKQFWEYTNGKLLAVQLRFIFYIQYSTVHTYQKSYGVVDVEMICEVHVRGCKVHYGEVDLPHICLA